MFIFFTLPLHLLLLEKQIIMLMTTHVKALQKAGMVGETVRGYNKLF